jgi:hypothetical protein
MIENKAITYSLLAHIRNSGTLMKGPVDVFVPLIKRTLHQLNNKDIFKGESILEIQSEANSMYSIDFPIPVLKIILAQISTEVNTDSEKNFVIHRDGSFILKAFYFEDFEEKIQESKRDSENLEKIFEDFCKMNNITVSNKTSIFDFIDKNKISISKYLSNHTAPNGHDFTIEAQFVDYFKKIPKVFDIVRRIYLGSIISSFLEYKTENFTQDVELLFDTNFIISLLDLNTPESTHTCKKLLEVGKNLGFKFTVLSDTIDETKALINKKAENFTNTFLTRRINPEDIYNACERRDINTSDLERIIDNIEESISSYGINIYKFTQKLKEKAKTSSEYESFKRIRTSHYSALHDAITVIYIKEKRTKRIREFENVNCWLVNNSTSHESEDYRENSSDYQKEAIRVDELLNILWLSNPSINTNLDNEDLIEIGLSSIVAYTLNDSLPKASIIRELDENIQKYRTDIITDKDIINISSRISNKQLKNINELNNLANQNKDEFVKKLKEEAVIQEKVEEERVLKFDKLYQRFEVQINTLDKTNLSIKTKEIELDKIKKDVEDEKIATHYKIDLLNAVVEQERKQKKELQKQIRKDKRQQYIDNEVTKWRKKTWNHLWICIALFGIIGFYTFYLCDFDLNKYDFFIKKYKENLYITGLLGLTFSLFSLFILKSFYEKYQNNSNIKSFKEMLIIPDNLKDE